MFPDHAKNETILCAQIQKLFPVITKGLGEVVCVAGMLSVLVCIVCAVLGIIKLRKGDVKKAASLALAGLAYSGIIFARLFHR